MARPDERLTVQREKRSLDDINRSVQVPSVYESSFFRSFWHTAGRVPWLLLVIWIRVTG